MPPRPALCLFLLFQGLFGLLAAGRPWRVQDEAMVYFQTESLWERGSLALSQVHPERLFGKAGRDGRRWAPYGPGVAFAALPHHGAGRALAAAAGLRRGAAGLDREGRISPWTGVVGAITSLAGSTWGALAVVALHAAALAAGARPRRAFLLAGLFGAGTFLLAYAGSLYSEPLAAALAAGCAALVLRDRPSAASLLLVALVLVKGTNLVLAPALVLLAWLHPDRTLGRRAATLLVGGAALGLATQAAWNSHRFGSMSEAGYSDAWRAMLGPGGDPVPFEAANLPRGLFILLLSPGKSLLLFAPPLLLLASGARARLARGPRLAACAGAALLSSLLVYGSYFYPEGGYCHGPRHLLPALPLLLLPLARGTLPRSAVRATLLAGALVGLLGARVSFMADQALGTERERQVYYRIVERPAPGRPLNVYRLDYLPDAGRLLDPDGVESLRAALRAPGAAVPRALPWVVSLAFFPLLGLGAGMGFRWIRFVK